MRFLNGYARQFIDEGELDYYPNDSNGINAFAFFQNGTPLLKSIAYDSIADSLDAGALKSDWDAATKDALYFGFFADVSDVNLEEIQSDIELLNAVKSIEGDKFFKTSPMSKEYVLNATSTVSKLEGIRLLSQISRVEKYERELTADEQTAARNAQELKRMPVRDFFSDHFFTISALLLFGLLQLEAK